MGAKAYLHENGNVARKVFSTPRNLKGVEGQSKFVVLGLDENQEVGLGNNENMEETNVAHVTSLLTLTYI